MAIMLAKRDPPEFADSDGAAVPCMLAEPIVRMVLLQQLTVYAMLLHEEHVSLLDAAEQQQQQQPAVSGWSSSSSSQPAVSGQSSSSSSSQPVEPGRRQPSKQRFCADLLDVPPFHLNLLQQLPGLASKGNWDAARAYDWGSAQEKWLLYCQRAVEIVYALNILVDFTHRIQARSSQQQPVSWRGWLFLPGVLKIVLELQLLAAAFVQRQRRQAAVLDAAGPAADLCCSAATDCFIT
jgi:hypothetical protein